MQLVFAPHAQQNVVVGGRRRPKVSRKDRVASGLHRMLVRYKGGALPAGPATLDYFAGVAGIGDMLMNNTLGCCTSSGAGHLIDTYTALAGAPVRVSDADVVAFYAASTGYVPGNPATDQGGDEVTVLDTWRDKGFDGKGGHAIAGYVGLDPENPAELRSAVYLFGGSYLGLELPDAWTASMPSASGFVWDAGTPDPNQGHCVVGGGYGAQGLAIATWGLKGTLTWAAIAELCSDANGGELFAILTPEVVARATELAPDGLDWNQLRADFQLLAA